MRKLIVKYLEEIKRKERNVSEVAQLLGVSRPTIYARKSKYEED
jgi:predicted DNA-binding transcriptional regulator AlpA